MNRHLYLCVFFAVSAAVLAQTADQQLETPALTAAARNLSRTTKVSDEVKAQAEKLITDAAAAQTGGAGGEVRRKLANAITLLNGAPWDQKTELAWSLALHADSQVADSSLPLIGRLSQF